MSWLKKLVGWIKSVFTGDFGSRLVRGVEAAAPYIRVAFEFSQVAAAMTPTRSDDEIIALANYLGVPALFDPQEDKGIVIGRIVFRALKMKYPEAADRVLNRAIEIAYGAIRP